MRKEQVVETLRDRISKVKTDQPPPAVKKYTADDARSAMETVVSRSARTLLSLKDYEARVKKGTKVYINNLPVYLAQVADVLANQARDLRDIKDKLDKGVEIQDSDDEV